MSFGNSLIFNMFYLSYNSSSFVNNGKILCIFDIQKENVLNKVIFSVCIIAILYVKIFCFYRSRYISNSVDNNYNKLYYSVNKSTLSLYISINHCCTLPDK